MSSNLNQRTSKETSPDCSSLFCVSSIGATSLGIHLFDAYSFVKSRKFTLVIISTLLAIAIALYVGFCRELFWCAWNIIIIGTVAAVATAFSAFFILSNRKTRIHLLIAALSSLCGLYFIEVALFLEVPKLFVTKEFDTRGRAEFVRDARSEGTELYLAVSPYHALNESFKVDKRPFLPLSGISKVNSALCNEFGSFYTYQADEYGFNNPVNTWSSPTFDIVIVGDSFSHGYCVPHGEFFGEQLRRKFPQLLNLGQTGNGPISELASIREFLPTKKVKHVVWFFYEGNDISDLEKELKHPVLSKYLSDKNFSQNLISRQEDVDNVLRAFEEKTIQYEAPITITASMKREFHRFTSDPLSIMTLWNTRSRLGLTEASRSWPAHLTGHATPIALQEVFESILREAKNRVSEYGADLTFVYLPAYRTFQRRQDHPWKTWIENLASNLKIRYVDITGVFNQTSDPLSLFPFRKDGHYTAEGNQLIANAVTEALTSNNPAS